MTNNNDKKSKEINDIISITRLASLLFCGIILFSTCSNNYEFGQESGYGNSFLWSVFIFSGIIAIVYWIWSFLLFVTIRIEYKKIAQIVESLIFIVIFTALILVSDSYQCQYKFIYLFIIITSTIQLGMRCGLIMAFISSIILGAIDLFLAPAVEVNTYFQNDLMLMGIFFIITWTLGYYVRIEVQSTKEKDLELKKLNKELENRDRVHKYVEEMLIKNQKCFDLLIQNSPNAIFVHLDGKLIFVNDYALKLLGFVRDDEILGKSFFDISPIEQKSYVKDKMRKIYEGADIEPFEVNVIKSNGEVIYIENTSISFIYNKKLAILSILRDMTYEKKMEKLQNDVEKNIQLLKESREINELTIEYFSDISHELKTPLNVIFTAVQMLILKNEKLLEGNKLEQKKYLNIIKQNCYRLTRLINNLLDVTKADAGFLKIQLQNFNVVNVVEEIVMSVAPYVESKGISITFDTDVEEKIMAIDPDKMERIILNLLSNSVKFTNYGGEIFVSITDKGESIDILVKDSGVGIPEDKLSIIFERFGQVEKTFRGNREGSGIGLSIVKTFVEMHGGTIDIKSKLYEGSEFIINLPVVVLNEEKYEENNVYSTNIERICTEFADVYSDVF